MFAENATSSRDRHRSMRVLIVPSWYPTPNSPVEGIFIREQVDALKEQHSVYVIFLNILPRNHKGNAKKTKSERRGYVEEFIDVPARPFIWRFTYLWYLARAYLRIRKIFAPQILHAHIALPAGWASVLLGRIFRMPVVITENSSTFDPWLSRLTWRLMAKQALNGADVVVAVGEGLRKRIVQTFHRKKRTIVIPNIVDTERFTASSFPSTEHGYRLLFVGLMDTTQKGVHVLLDALSQIQAKQKIKLHVDLVGDGRLKHEYEEQVVKLGLVEMVTFHGVLTHESIAEMMQRSHALVLPSLHEASPLVIVEALASGRPVISTRCGGPEYMVDESNGLIIEPEQPDALADGVFELLTHLERYDPHAISEAAKNLYSYHAVTDALTNLYSELVNKGQKKHTRPRR